MKKGTYGQLLKMGEETSDVGKPKTQKPEFVTGEGVAHESEQESEQKVAHNDEQKSAHKSEQVASALSNEAVESLWFSMRNADRVKVNTKIPVEWKAEVDEICERLGVGKYEIFWF